MCKEFNGNGASFNTIDAIDKRFYIALSQIQKFSYTWVKELQPLYSGTNGAESAPS